MCDVTDVRRIEPTDLISLAAANTDKMVAYAYRSESSSDESVSDLESIEGYRFQPKQQGRTLQDAPKGKRGEENLLEAEMAR